MQDYRVLKKFEKKALKIKKNIINNSTFVLEFSSFLFVVVSFRINFVFTLNKMLKNEKGRILYKNNSI